MLLPIAPNAYDKQDQDTLRHNIASEDAKNLKMGQVFDKLLFRDTVDGKVKTVTVASGVLVVT